MKKSRKIILIIAIVVAVAVIVSGCVEKKERWTMDERGIGKDTYYEPSDDIPGFELPLLLFAIIAIVYKVKNKQE